MFDHEHRSFGAGAHEDHSWWRRECVVKNHPRKIIIKCDQDALFMDGDRQDKTIIG